MTMTPLARFICLISLIFGGWMGYQMLLPEIDRTEFEAHDRGYDEGYDRGRQDMRDDMLQSFNDITHAFGECVERELRCQSLRPEDTNER